MNQRKRKHTVIELFHYRFYNTRFMWRSAEENSWLDVAAISHDFGSPDYARLTQEDAQKMRTELHRG